MRDNNDIQPGNADRELSPIETLYLKCVQIAGWIFVGFMALGVAVYCLDGVLKWKI